MGKYIKYKKKYYLIKKRRLIIIRKSLFLFLILFFFIFLSTSFFLFFSKKFQIKEIKILGNEQIKTESLERIILNKIRKRFIFFESRSIFLINKKKLTKEVLKKYPEIEKIKIEKEFPRLLIINIKERKPLGLFCQQKECFLIDKNGIIFKKFEKTSKNQIIIRFLNSLNLDKILGKQIINKKIIDRILIIKNNLKDNFQIKIKEVFISLPKLEIKTGENWFIYLKLNSNFDLQMTKLNLLLKDEISSQDRKNLEYIDLRFSKVYYRYR